jgi:trans-2,3-dihydro-3-hydroxyanthranilate isomerase
MTAMRLAFDIVDVFTERPFAGNQLAVVHGADDLSTEQCQALTREFNFSESTFPTAAADGGSYSTRIFTPAQEIPFAGHPTLGTAWVLRSRGLLNGDEVTQHCGAGEVGVRFDDELVELSAAPRDLAGPVDPGLVEEMLSVFGLSGSDVAGDAWVAGAGLSFVHVPVTEEAVVRAAPSSAPFAPYAERLAALDGVEDLIDAVNVHAVAGDAPHLQVHSRVFVPGVGVPEDPATGSAAAGLGMALVASGRLPAGGRYDVRQGIEMGRPSALRCRVEAVEGRATRCHVGGRVQPVASGEIEVP